MAQVKQSDDPFIVIGDKVWCVGCRLNNGVTLEVLDADKHEQAHNARAAIDTPTIKAKR